MKSHSKLLSLGLMITVGFGALNLHPTPAHALSMETQQVQWESWDTWVGLVAEMGKTVSIARRNIQTLRKRIQTFKALAQSTPKSLGEHMARAATLMYLVELSDRDLKSCALPSAIEARASAAIWSIRNQVVNKTPQASIPTLEQISSILTYLDDAMRWFE